MDMLNKYGEPPSPSPQPLLFPLRQFRLLRLLRLLRVHIDAPAALLYHATIVCVAAWKERSCGRECALLRR